MRNTILIWVSKFFAVICAATGILLLSQPCFANIVQIEYDSANTTTEWTGHGESGIVGIYNGKVNGVPTEFVCDDFLSHILPGQKWNAYVNSNSPVTTGSTGVKFQIGVNGYELTNPDLQAGANGIPSGGLTTQELYNMVSYLVAEMFNPHTPESDWLDLTGAIWSITDSAWENGNTGNKSAAYINDARPDVIAALDNAGLNSHYVPPQFVVYTPTPQNSGQEFFGMVAEPSFPILLGVTLLGCGALGKKLFS